MNNFYIDKILEKRKGYMSVYDEIIAEIFGEKLTWEEITHLNIDKLRQIMIELNKRITIVQSKYDIQKLARAIQDSRSGMGGCAMTEFECAFCGEKEIWNNTATPKICKACAERMAENIVLNNMKLEKY